jgi:hypothetical protein
MSRLSRVSSATAELEGQARSGVADADVTIDEHARHIHKILGVTGDDPQRARRIAIRNAQADGSHCAQCRQALAATDPVWRKSLYMGPGFFGSRRDTIAPCCRRCTPAKAGEYLGPEPCGGCGRPVYTEDDRRMRVRVICSDKCRQQVRAREARELRRLDPIPCETCGEIFEPARSDARFCSGACKQAAYRRRVTDRKSVTRDAFKSRNARPQAEAAE